MREVAGTLIRFGHPTNEEIRAYAASSEPAPDVDSSCTPLRRGTSGICLAHSGFRAVNDYVGTLDLFGRAFRVSQANVAGGLAAAAVLTMGEGDERTPICLLEDLPFVHFEDRDPDSAAQKMDVIRPEEDLYSLFLESIDWISGDRVRGK